jgi:hypothetical protein
MTKKKVKEPDIDQKSPDFIAFVKQFNYRMNKDKKSFYMEATSSCIADEAVAKPPHYEITLVLFPDSSLTTFLAIAEEIYNKGQSCMDEIHDYYDTHYPEYSFQITFVDLYRIYLKHK